MKSPAVLLGCLLLFSSAAVAEITPPAHPQFPSVADQLKKAHAKPGSALEKLIRENQDFGRLKPRDAADQAVPPWLKVYFQKKHPELNYDNELDPTGGYPLVLKEVFEWMETHQDFQPGNPEASLAPAREFGDRDDGEASTQSLGQRLQLASMAATVGTNVRTSGAQTSARSESDIRINPWSPSKIIAASNNISGSGAQAQFYSTDGGTTWGQTYVPLVSGDYFDSDPAVDWTSDGTAWSMTLGIDSSITNLIGRSYRSTNNGATWTYDAAFSGSQTDVDKEMMWIDHSASSAYANNVYVIWHNGAPAYMNRRTSAGWGTPIKVSGTETYGTAIGSDVKTNSAGDVFGFYPDTGSRGIYVVKSTNGGASYSTPVPIVTTYDSYDIGVPAMNSRRALIYVSGGAYKNGATNNVYALWPDLSGDTGCTSGANEPGSNTASTCKMRIWFSRSTDGGATWSTRVKINNQSGLNDQFNPFLAVDESTGIIGAIYYDTVNDAGRKKVDVYYQMSTDGGATWQAAVKVTTATTDETVSGTDFGNQFGDYNSLSGYANVFFPSWTDRRNNAREEIWTAKVTTTSAPTFSISGSAGTSGATISAGASSTASDGSNNYTLSGLVAGSYTVTPSKAGCTFSPTSAPVTITSANVTGVNFTATCVATYTISGNVGLASATVTVGAASTSSDSGGNYAVSGLVAGTYTVTPSAGGCTFTPASRSVTITSANVVANFASACTGDTQLTSGVAVTGQSVALGGWKYYYITVPAGSTSLTFATSSASGDVDIYTQINVRPTYSSFICRPYTGSGNETCTANNPAAGTWWVGVNGYSAGSYTITATILPTPPSGNKWVHGDYDGDGKTDAAVYRPSNYTWYIATTSPRTVVWGGVGDKPAPGDFDGDGKADITIFRPSNGTFYILQSSNGATRTVQIGQSGDIPVPADYDGDGRSDVAVFRVSTGVWYILQSSTNVLRTVQWGGSGGDIPVPADYDGDGKDDIAIQNPGTGQWFIINSSNGSTRVVQWGGSGGDVPLPYDYDGDGKADIALENPGNGIWYIVNSSNGSTRLVQWGGSGGDSPQPGRYDGDAKSDIVIFNPGAGQFYIIYSTNGATVVTTLGQSGDIGVSR